jgi:SAM-dependent methyltransferase
MVISQESRTADRGRYGVDAPGGLISLFTASAAMLAGGSALHARHPKVGRALQLSGLAQGITALSYLHTTLCGKFAVWEEELDCLRLTGTERVLDVGCGRGVVLIAVARRLTTGRATGVALWQAKDQSGNAEHATRANALAEGVSDRVGLDTGDMRSLPYPDDSFDVVVSSLAIHTLPGVAGRGRAVSEAWRVLRPGGRLLVADIAHVGRYADVVRRAGAVDVEVRDLGWRFWYGGPWFSTTMLAARKP